MSPCAARRSALLALLLLPLLAHAETQYVIDRLLIGIHEDKALNSAIIKVVPTGTPLDVLEHDGEFVRVRAPDGIVGWVDGSYLMEQKPAQLVVPELRARQDQLAGELEEARAQIEQLQAEARTAREAQQAAEEAAARRSAGPDPATTEALRGMQRVAEENQRLKERITRLEEELAEQPPPPAAAPPAAARAAPDPQRAGAAQAPARATGRLPWRAPELEPWQWAVLGFGVLLAFALGAYVVDYGVRRRHGGFRV